MSFQDKLMSGEFTLTAEVTPPLSADPADLMAKAAPLKGVADAVNVTDGASARVHMDSLIAAILLKENGIEPILQMTCRDKNRIALQSALVGAAAMGVRNILVLRGDDPSKGDQKDAKPVFDWSSTELIAAAVSIRDRGELPHGRKVDGKAAYVLGAADAPIDPPADWEPKGLAAKVEAGAQFAQTQFCMDVEVAGRYFARLAEAGLTERVRILVGVAPFASARSARWIKDNLFGTVVPDAFIDRMEAASDPKAEGKAIAVEVLKGLAEIPGVAGAHIMAPLNEAAIPDVITTFRG